MQRVTRPAWMLNNSQTPCIFIVLPGRADALALSNCIERCDAVESCAGFVFARGLNSTARCCFRSDTTTKIHKQSAFTCVEKKKKYKRSRSSVHTEKEEDDSLESTGSTDLKGVDA
eukprot:1385980-Amorphochlora_amoeboformis.AAC.1